MRASPLGILPTGEILAGQRHFWQIPPHLVLAPDLLSHGIVLFWKSGAVQLGYVDVVLAITISDPCRLGVDSILQPRK